MIVSLAVKSRDTSSVEPNAAGSARSKTIFYPGSWRVAVGTPFVPRQPKVFRLTLAPNHVPEVIWLEELGPPLPRRCMNGRSSVVTVSFQKTRIRKTLPAPAPAPAVYKPLPPGPLPSYSFTGVSPSPFFLRDANSPPFFLHWLFSPPIHRRANRTFVFRPQMGTYFPGYLTGGLDWMSNLSAPDPTWTLPILTSASMMVSHGTTRTRLLACWLACLPGFAALVGFVARVGSGWMVVGVLVRDKTMYFIFDCFEEMHPRPV